MKESTPRTAHHVLPGEVDRLEIKDFTKVVRIGLSRPLWTKRGFHIYCNIKYVNGKLSITGVEGPNMYGGCRGSCGQIGDHINITEFAPGWTQAVLNEFIQIWDRWHLNDFKAGSPAQQQHLRDHPIKGRHSHYEESIKSLNKAGLNPDPNYQKNGKPYEYGTAWLTEEIPSEVIEFLQSLPTADRSPAWV